MKLANNIVRINGRKDGHKTHIDIEVRMTKVVFYNSQGTKFEIDAPETARDFAQIGFDKGLDAVNSINYWNWCGRERMTIKV